MGSVMIRDRGSKTSSLITIGLLIIMGTRVQAEKSATNIGDSVEGTAPARVVNTFTMNTSFT